MPEQVEVEINPEDVTPDQYREMFQSDEILWYRNGRWGASGYAVPNCAGKTWTDNSTIYRVHSGMGRTLFDLMHREAVKFNEPPHVSYWWDAHKALILLRKRLFDRANAKDQDRTLENIHVKPDRRTFMVWPVPYFGQRIRQEDIRELCQLGLVLLSEMMQHNGNLRSYYVTQEFAIMCGGYVDEMIALIATKYFGYTREEIKALQYTIPENDFNERINGGKYDPWTQVIPIEQSTERPSPQWWPTENDLSGINGLAVTDVYQNGHIARWPDSHHLAEGDWETINPGRPMEDGNQTRSRSRTGRPVTG